jgi:hypothetical protein
VSEPDASSLDLTRLIETLERAYALRSRLDPHAPPAWRELLEALRCLPEVLARLRADADRLERLEDQVGELLDRLLVMETALRSAHEARDAAALSLADMWLAMTGERRTPAPQEIADEIRRLKARAV